MIGYKSWLNRKFRDGELFYMEVQYIHEHICPEQKHRLLENPDDWTLSKEYLIEGLLDTGINPIKLGPIEISLHPEKEEFSVGDGISRLRVFKKRNIKDIYAKVHHG